MYSSNSSGAVLSSSNTATPTSAITTILQTPSGNTNSVSIANAGEASNDAQASNSPDESTSGVTISQVIKGLILFLSQESSQPLWNYEDITAKVWSIKSAEQLTYFLHHVVKVYSDSYPHARISERWAQTALQLGLSCSSRHYAGRSLQVFRALNVPINSRMLSDILSRLIETVAEQGEDMQGYVTELLLTLEAAVDSLDSDFRPLDVMKDIFKSTPNLNNKDGVNVAPGGKKSPSGVAPQTQNHMVTPGHARSTSYSVSYCTRKVSSSPSDKQGKFRFRIVLMQRVSSSRDSNSIDSRSKNFSKTRINIKKSLKYFYP